MALSSQNASSATDRCARALSGILTQGQVIYDSPRAITFVDTGINLPYNPSFWPSCTDRLTITAWVSQQTDAGRFIQDGGAVQEAWMGPPTGYVPGKVPDSFWNLLGVTVHLTRPLNLRLPHGKPRGFRVYVADRYDATAGELFDQFTSDQATKLSHDLGDGGPTDGGSRWVHAHAPVPSAPNTKIFVP